MTCAHLKTTSACSSLHWGPNLGPAAVRVCWAPQHGGIFGEALGVSVFWVESLTLGPPESCLEGMGFPLINLVCPVRDGQFNCHPDTMYNSEKKVSVEDCLDQAGKSVGFVFAFIDVGRCSLKGDSNIPWFGDLDNLRAEKDIQTPACVSSFLLLDCGCD